MNDKGVCRTAPATPGLLITTMPCSSPPFLASGHLGAIGGGANGNREKSHFGILSKIPLNIIEVPYVVEYLFRVAESKD